jgi:hypothetical protein
MLDRGLGQSHDRKLEKPQSGFAIRIAPGAMLRLRLRRRWPAGLDAWRSNT